jgi:hypothetical protein
VNIRPHVDFEKKIFRRFDSAGFAERLFSVSCARP